MGAREKETMKNEVVHRMNVGIPGQVMNPVITVHRITPIVIATMIMSVLMIAGVIMTEVLAKTEVEVEVAVEVVVAVAVAVVVAVVPIHREMITHHDVKHREGSS
mmetsp:Transcript_16487/g.30186  ORF Transcript_16487/g.30186 Transcript_16487/m.30186 type:complete len:105 (-) Transcript_16487:60-374(-)